MTATLAGVVPGIVDTHIHQWDPFSTPREASRFAPLYRRVPRVFDRLFPLLVTQDKREMILTAEHVARPYLPASYAADVAGVAAEVGVPVDATIHVEADWKSDDPVEETRWLDALPFGRDGAPRLAAVLANADPRSPGFARTLDAHAAASDRFRGIRGKATWHDDPKVLRWADGDGLLRDRDFLGGFAALAERGLSYDAYLYSHQLPDLALLADEYPEVTIVVDHYATPVGVLGPMGRATGRTEADRSRILGRWREDLAAVAERPNVVAKHSGLAFPMLGLREVGIGRAELAERVAPLVEHTTDVFGEDRLMFGSNYPMDKAVTAYPTIVGALLDLLAPRGPELLAKVFRTNAERVYRL